MYPYSQKFEGAKTEQAQDVATVMYPYSQKFEGAKTTT